MEPDPLHCLKVVIFYNLPEKKTKYIFLGRRDFAEILNRLGEYAKYAKYAKYSKYAIHAKDIKRPNIHKKKKYNYRNKFSNNFYWSLLHLLIVATYENIVFVIVLLYIFYIRKVYMKMCNIFYPYKYH